MKVLVTGGAGFIGSAICRQLLARGDEVIAYQRSGAASLRSLGAAVRRGDIDAFSPMAHAMRGCDAVIHTAGKAGVWGPAAEYRRVNVEGTRTVIRACRAAGVPVLVHTSSPSVVHAGGDIEGGDESLPLARRFLSPYPESKAQAESLVLAANSPELRTAALRPHLVWGPGDPHILPRLRARVRRGRLYLPGADRRVDTVFVDNAAQAHLLALDELRGAARSAGKAYFISNGEPLPQGEIIARLLAAAGVPVTIRPLPAWLARMAGLLCEGAWRLLALGGEPPITRFSADQLATAHWFDIGAARRDLGYRPGISIAAGLERLAAFTAAGP